MEKFLRTTLMVLGIVVLALLLFNLGAQLYWMVAGPTWVGPMAMAGPMMGGRLGIHPFGGFGFGFLGPILGIALVGLIVAGIVALVRGRGEAGGAVVKSESGVASTPE
ncbi:MAG TPA: hypothetical protein VK449_05420 [Anaerolineales bacterium]|nr:hypothetical protein [Anaerolineales bacterium]